MTYKIFIPDYIKTALNVLESAGHEAYLVGGCVRDALLGNPAEDFDIATSALPEQTLALFEKDFKLVLNGMKHGTVTPIIDSHPVEITTFRTDGDYSDNRHPDSVSFSLSLKEDLARRDFTVNAMAYNEKGGIIDLFGSENDLKSRLIKCVGEPDRRFGEDALRIMRALRFSAVLGFEIEEKTAKSINKNIKTILSVSAERLYSELKKLLSGEFCADVLEKFPCLLQTLFEIELDEKKIKALQKKSTVNMRLAVIFAKENPEKLKSLKPDNDSYNFVKNLNEYFFLPLGESQKEPSALALFLYENGVDKKTFFYLLTLHSLLEEDFPFPQFMAAFAEAEQKGICISQKELNISGTDLIKLGLSGEEIGAMLDTLTKAIITGKCENRKSKLIKFASLTMKSAIADEITS